MQVFDWFHLLFIRVRIRNTTPLSKSINTEELVRIQMLHSDMTCTDTEVHMKRDLSFWPMGT